MVEAGGVVFCDFVRHLYMNGIAVGDRMLGCKILIFAQIYPIYSNLPKKNLLGDAFMYGH